MPIAVVDRLGPSLYATAGTAGQALARARIPEAAAALAGRPHAAGLGLPARAEVAAVLDGAAGRAAASHKSDVEIATSRSQNRGTAGRLKPLTRRAYLSACACFAGPLMQ